MCSIAGYLRPSRDTDDARALRAMNRALAHRGPDDAGVLLAAGSPHGKLAELPDRDPGFPHRVGLAHNRFSILDPTPAGHQPYRSPDGRYTLIFNGEIYNHAELRPELAAAGWQFRSHCDTEVLLAAFAVWGDGCFKRLNGFWAAAFWDNHLARLTLSRDRFGEAPLYHCRHDGNLYFASEIPALFAVLGRDAFPVSSQAVSDYLHHGLSDVAGHSFHTGLRQIPPATFAHVRPDGTLDIRPYWSLPAGRVSERSLPADEAVTRLRDSLTRATRLRLHADVPVGFQLSGGMDSSALVAFAASAGQKLDAFTVSYPGTKHDEFPFARAVADRFPGLVTHHELREPGDEFWAHADAVVYRYAEPFSGPNAFTQQLTWQAMRDRGIKVVVSGGAGDELLAGYRRDFHAPFLRSLLASGHPLAALHESAELSEEPLPKWSKANWKRLAAALRSAGPVTPAGHIALSTPGSAVHFLPADLLPTRGLPAPHTTPAGSLDDRLRAVMGDWRMSYWLKIGNLSSLAVPVELRLPFLDHEVAELAFSLPATYLIRDGWMKWILRKAAEPLLPPEVVWRKRKMGFPFPYTDWAKRSRPRFEAAIDASRTPWLDHAKLLTHWDTLAEKNPIFLWRCMSLALWHRRCVEAKPLSPASRLHAAA